MPDTKLHVTEMWKKTIIDEKIETNPLVKSDLHWDLSERCYLKQNVFVINSFRVMILAGFITYVARLSIYGVSCQHSHLSNKMKKMVLNLFAIFRMQLHPSRQLREIINMLLITRFLKEWIHLDLNPLPVVHSSRPRTKQRPAHSCTNFQKLQIKQLTEIINYGTSDKTKNENL